jgi:hypothetical protein
MSYTITEQAKRRSRLTELLNHEVREVYDDEAQAVLAGKKECPRYALLTAEDAHRDNPNLTVHETIEDLAQQASSECNEQYAWPPQRIVDLDTGRELDYVIKVDVFDPLQKAPNA